MALQAELNQMLDSRGRGAASELARRLDVTPQTVAKWRSGQVSVPMGRLIDICIALEEPDVARLARLTPGWELLTSKTQEMIAKGPGQGSTMWRRNFGSKSERNEPSPFDVGERRPRLLPTSRRQAEQARTDGWQNATMFRLNRLEQDVAEIRRALNLPPSYLINDPADFLDHAAQEDEDGVLDARTETPAEENPEV